MKKLIVLLLLKNIVSVEGFSFENVPRIFSSLFEVTVTTEETNVDPNLPNHFCPTSLESNLQEDALEHFLVILENKMRKQEIIQALIEASSSLITKQSTVEEGDSVSTYKLTLKYTESGDFVPITSDFARGQDYIFATFRSFHDNINVLKLELRIVIDKKSNNEDNYDLC